MRLVLSFETYYVMTEPQLSGYSTHRGTLIRLLNLGDGVEMEVESHAIRWRKLSLCKQYLLARVHCISNDDGVYSPIIPTLHYLLPMTQ